MWFRSNLLRRSPNSLSDPVLSERVRMARELHDGLAQDLAAIGYQIDQLASSENVGNQTRSKLRSVRQGISELLTQVRNDIFELRSDENIKQLPAERVLKNQLDSILTETGITLGVKGKVFYNYEIFRIIRELTTNSIKHSNCKNIEINFKDSSVEFRDDCDEAQINSAFGLSGVLERAEKSGFRFEFQESPKIFRIIKNL